MRKYRFDNTNGLNSPAGQELLLTLDDYEIWYRITLKDPDDKEAWLMLQDCESYILDEPSVRYFIDDPGEYLYELDKIIEAEFRRRMECQL